MKTIKTSVVSLFAALILFSSCGSFGEGLLAGLAGMSGYGSLGGYGGASSFSGGSGNMDYLLDPNYAIAQTVAQNQQMNQVGQAIAVQTINQVSNQEELEYLEFCKYNKKSDGTNYTKSEWRALKGQAIQNMKSDNTPSNSRETPSNTPTSSKRCKKLSATDMAHCNGNGKCPKCNGSKKYFDTSYGVPKWVDPCETCNGSGKCPSCHGTGSRY